MPFHDLLCEVRSRSKDRTLPNSGRNFQKIPDSWHFRNSKLSVLFFLFVRKMGAFKGQTSA